MIGFILAGGEHHSEFSQLHPKPLMELKPGYTILEKQMLNLASSGIHEALIAGSPQILERIQQRFSTEYKGFKLDYLPEQRPLGTWGAIRSGLESTGKDLVVFNGDIVTDINLRKLIARFRDSNLLGMVFVTKLRVPYGVTLLEDAYRIISFREKPVLDQYISGGVYCISNKLIDYGFDSEGDLERIVFPELASMGKLGYHREDDTFWISVDSPRDLEYARKEFGNRYDKPWGYEKWLITTEKYAAKEIFIKEGYSTSYHYHTQKDESLVVLKGMLKIKLEHQVCILERNDLIRILPNTPHSIAGMENSVVLEVSTPQPEDSVRLEDYYSFR